MHVQLVFTDVCIVPDHYGKLVNLAVIITADIEVRIGEKLG